MANHAFTVEWNKDLIRPPNSVRKLSFTGTKCNMSYERMQDHSIITCFLKDHENDAEFKDALTYLVIASFNKDRNDNHDKAFEILKNGIKFIEEPRLIYRYIGHTNSQLRAREGKSCFLLPFQTATNVAVYDFLDKFADFSKIKTIEKQAKRISLLFSRFYHIIKLPTSNYGMIKDVQNRKFIFTDGCGWMSTEFAKKIGEKLSLNYVPSVCQFRYQGNKGVVMHVPELDKYDVCFRDSNHKFDVSSQYENELDYFGIVECSKPFSRAYLNTQFLMLLESVGVKEQILKKFLSDYFKLLQELPSSKSSAIEYLSCIGKNKLVEQIKSENGINDDMKKTLERLQREEVDKLKKNPSEYSEKYRIRILIQKGRCVFGVADPYNLLSEGECYFQPTLNNEDVESFKNSTHVVVSRNPCYHPGDIRLLKLNKQHAAHYEHLNDCVVFSIRGDRPLADMMSGGDLDGDKFFVIWDSNLFPTNLHDPYDYKLDDGSSQEVFEPKLENNNIILKSSARRKSSDNVRFSASSDRRDSMRSNNDYRRESYASEFSSIDSVFADKIKKQEIKQTKTIVKEASISSSSLRDETQNIRINGNSLVIHYPIDFVCACKEKFTKDIKSVEKTITEHFEKHNVTALKYLCRKCLVKESESYRGISTHYSRCKGDEDTSKSKTSVSTIDDNQNDAEPVVEVKPKEKRNSRLVSAASVTSESSTVVNVNDDGVQYVEAVTDSLIIYYPLNLKCFCGDYFTKDIKSVEKTLIEHFINKHKAKELKFCCINGDKQSDTYRGIALHYSRCTAVRLSNPVNSSPQQDKFRKASSIDSISPNCTVTKKSTEKTRLSAKPQGQEIVEIDEKFVLKYPINFTCPCGEIFDNEIKSLSGVLIEHYQNEHGLTSLTFLCGKCNNRKFDKYQSVARHYASCKEEPSSPQSTIDSKDSETKASQNSNEKDQNQAASKTPVDEQQILDKNQKNLNILVPMNFRCICDKDFKKVKNPSETIPKHFSEEHGAFKVLYECRICGSTLKDYHMMASHCGTCAKTNGATPIKSNNVETEPKVNIKKVETSKQKLTDAEKDEFRRKLIEYFSKFDTSLLGTMDSIFMKFAEIQGPECDECVELNKHLSAALDTNLSRNEMKGMLDRLRKTLDQKVKENKQQFVQTCKVWKDLELMCNDFFKNTKK